MKSTTSRKRQIPSSGNSNSGNSNSFFKGRSSKTGIVALCSALLCSLLTAQPSRGGVYSGELVHFRPPSGQPLFPAGNLTVFKQFLIAEGFSERLSAKTSVDFFFTSADFGGEVGASLDVAFGLEVGLCFGGNATFDLGFQPSIALPEKYPYDVPIPLDVSAQLLKKFVNPDTQTEVQSGFKTELPPLGKAYADLIFDVEANLDAEACVFGCFDVFDFGISTCDVPALPDGTKIFKRSKRCDLSLTEKPRCAIELASFNRDNNNELRVLNVAAKNFAEFLNKPYKEYAPKRSSKGDFSQTSTKNTLFVFETSPIRSKIKNGQAVQVSGGSLPTGLDASRIYYVKNAVKEEEYASFLKGVNFQLATSSGGAVIQIGDQGGGKIETLDPNNDDEPESGCYGKVEFSIPATISSDSTQSPYNKGEVLDSLHSSGAEDIMSIGIDLPKIASEFLKPLPPLSGGGSVGPVSFDYTLASVELGPAVQVQTAFEMTWDLVVTEMTFSQEVKVVGYGQGPEGVTKFIPSQGQVHLTNCGPKALPMIQMTKQTDGQNVEVEIKYVLQPKLKTTVSVPIIGQLDYQFFGAGANIDYIGRIGFGPLMEDSHKFKLGDFKVYESDPNPIASVGNGSIKFTMKSSGPPSFAWNPSQTNNASDLWTYLNPTNKTTNWLETISNITNSYPGFNSTSSSFATIAREVDDTLDPKLKTALKVDSLRVVDNNKLTIHRLSSDAVGPVSAEGGAELGVVGGLLENTGQIEILSASRNNSLAFEGPAGILCGDGELYLMSDRDKGFVSSITGPKGLSFSFCNFNTIRGSGYAMNQYGVSENSYIKNDGIFRSETTLGARHELETSANTFENLWRLEASKDSTLKVSGDALINRLDSNVSSSVEGASVLLNFDSIEHSGQMRAESGGALTLAPKKAVRGTMQAGLSTEGNGYVYALGKDGNDKSSLVKLDKMDITGGCFFAQQGGSIEATGGTGFTGSMFHIGNSNSASIDEDSGTLTLTTGDFNNICLSNFGTVKVMDNSDVNFSQNVVFTNHGKVVVSPGATLKISEDQVVVLGDEIRKQPGATNATASRTINRGQADEAIIGGTLMGGTWDVAGKLLMEGALFNAIGANSATPSTASGSIDGNKDIINEAGEGGDRAISKGEAASVILRGTNYDFPALYDLCCNRGSFTLTEGANFPKDINTQTRGDLVNKGKIEINTGSQMNIGESFIQSGEGAYTSISGSLNSATNDYQILGGTFNADAAANVFGIASSNSIPTGTSILLRSVLVKGVEKVWDGTPNTQPARVVITINKSITSIANGATLEIDGKISENASDTRGIYFPALNLTNNDGTLILTSGYGGAGSRLEKKFGDDTNGFTNTGQIKVTGPDTKISFNNYQQTGVDSEIYVGSDSQVVFFSSPSISAGKVTVEISQRSPTGRFEDPGVPGYGNGHLSSSGILTLGNKLAINFSGDLTKSVDIGDSWDITPRSEQVTIDEDQVTWLVGGKPMPTDWLPAGSELKIVQYRYQNDPTQPLKGLTIRVAPKGGFTDYKTWAITTLNNDPTLTYLADPYSDANGDGVSNALEFFFGLDGVNRTSDQVGEAALVNRDDGQYFELSFVRPIGVDASYAPYVSTDLKTWTLGRMLIKGITPGPGEGFERVTLETSATFGISRLFFRIQPSFNPDNFYPGQLPYQPYGNPITWSSGLENFAGSLFDNAQYPENYEVQPGRVFYLNTTGSDSGKNSLHGGTALDGSRNYIYYAPSPVAAAAMHAGLLDNGERGFLKVTFMEPQATYTGSPQKSPNGQTITSGTKTPGAAFFNDYSYKLELVGIAGTKTPGLTWKPFQITQFRQAGNLLSTNDLNAVASVPGTFDYDPPLGTPIEADPGARTMTLNVTFYPSDSVRYRTVSKSVIINVSSPSVTSN